MSKRNTVLAAAVADAVAVVIFCSVGRRSHAEGVTPTRLMAMAA